MVSDLARAFPLIVGVSIVTAAIAYWRAEEMASMPEPAPIAAATRRSFTSAYLAASLAFGPVAVAAYRWMEGRLLADAAAGFLKLGGGAALGLSVLALVGLPLMRRKGTPKFIALNLLWGLGYGYFLPRLIG